jgi:hypothetical protein
MTKAEQTRAVEKRTHERLAARKEAAKKGAETRRAKREEQLAEAAAKKAALKKHEDKLVAETRKVLDTEAAATAEGQQPEVAKAQTKRPERPTAQKSDSRPGGQASAGMATVALRGEQAQRFRALAVKRDLSLSKLLVRMMEVFEAQAR